MPGKHKPYLDPKERIITAILCRFQRPLATPCLTNANSPGGQPKLRDLLYYPPPSFEGVETPAE